MPDYTSTQYCHVCDHQWTVGEGITDQNVARELHYGPYRCPKCGQAHEWCEGFSPMFRQGEVTMLREIARLCLSSSDSPIAAAKKWREQFAESGDAR